MLRQLILFIFCCLFLLTSCKKNKPDPQCIAPAIIPMQPYSYPVWHPNGQTIGFNHTPLAGIGSNGNAPCIWYSYMGKADSTGFYLMNRDGTGFKRVTNFYLNTPAWSPDGHWIAFSIPPNIYKMPFNGSTFDTTQIIQLTTTGGNFYPSWTPEGDSIFYDSNVGTNGQGYYVWKMARDGGGKIGFPETGRQPFAANNGKIYYVGGVNGQPEIFSMNRDGSGKTQVTLNGQYGNRRTPKFFGNNLFYEDNGTLRKINTAGIDITLANPSVTYDISVTGEIVYSKMESDIMKYNKQIGTLWIMNADGTNNRQLTFNNSF
jgi:Tol biopolymer transport system component